MLSGDAAATLRSSGRRGRAQQVAAAAAAAAGAAPRGGSEHLPLLVRASRSAARRALLLALTLGLLSAASGSPGDQSLAFRRCHAQCIRTGCASLAPAGEPSTQQQCSPLCGGSSSSGGGDGAVPLALRLWRWDCAADCSYHCMWLVEGSRAAAAAAAGGGRQAAVWKYFGKWPFARWGGMQEPASVLFSLANLAAHALCLRRFRRLCRGLGGGRRGASSGAANGSSGASGSGGSASPYAYAWLWQARGVEGAVEEHAGCCCALALIAAAKPSSSRCSTG